MVRDREDVAAAWGRLTYYAHRIRGKSQEKTTRGGESESPSLLIKYSLGGESGDASLETGPPVSRAMTQVFEGKS